MSLEATKDPAAMVEDADRLIERLFGDLGKLDAERLAHHQRLAGYIREAGEMAEAEKAVEIGRIMDRHYVQWHLARVNYLRELSMLIETRAMVLDGAWS